LVAVAPGASQYMVQGGWYMALTGKGREPVAHPCLCGKTEKEKVKIAIRKKCPVFLEHYSQTLIQ